MKIKRLDLKAYGHFTDCSLDFSSETPGLHIIYGPNEAGKSTSLRALQGLLYGIPMRTADNFLHDYTKLMIGGHLENSDGNELTFWRRKKNVGDLLDSDQNIIDQAVLSEFLHGIEEPLFTALFGIDHETLVSGGRDILEQKGDIGQALFSAGAGLSSLHGIIESMEKECEGLFKAGGSRPELNQAIKAYQEIKKEIRNLSLSSTVWKEQKEVFDSASSELGQIEEQKQALSAELERLKRLQRATPNLVKRVALQETLSDLGDFDHLPQDFSARLQQALESQKKILKTLQEATSHQEDLDQRKNQSTLRQDILDQSETIDALHQKLGVQRQAEKDRPGIYTQLIACRTEAETLLNQVAPSLELSQAEKIKDLLARRQTILTLGNRFAGLDHALNQSESQVKTLADELAHIETQLETTTDVADLRELNAAVTTAQRAGDIDGTLRNLKRDSDALMLTAETDLKQMGLWKGPLESLLSLTLPSAATVDMYVEDYRESAENHRQNQQSQADAHEELDRIRRDIEAIRKAGAVVTEDDLSQARNRRDRGWQLVKRVWLEDETLEKEINEYDQTKDLPGAFERGMQAADEVSDQLRSAADRVHQYASLLADEEKLQQRLQRLVEDAAKLGEQKEQLERTWLALWVDSKLEPLTPREMRGWIDQCQDVCRNIRDGKRKESEKQPLIEQRKQLCAALVNELMNVGEKKELASDELTPVLAYAEQIFSELKAVKDQRQSLQNDKRRSQKDLSATTAELNAAQQAMNDWKQQWASVLDGFGLPEDAAADDAANALETLRICLDKKAEIVGYERRIEDIDQHAGEFDTSVNALVHSIAPELEALTSDQAVVKLLAMVKEAEKAKSVLEKLEEDIASTQEIRRQANVAQQSIEAEMASLRGLARSENDEDLLAVESRFCDHQHISRELASLEDTLLGIAEGIELDVLEEQRQAVDPNELPGQIEGLLRQIQDELEPQIKLLSERKGAAHNELQKMDGSGEAAAMEDDLQAALAKVRRLADRYLRVRLGGQLLKKEIERYRQENQDPILKMASRYFSELTLEAFPGLRSDLDDHGNPILVGVCPDGRIKTVEGMSSGTRDQLYLALRLATLEWRLEKHEPMPFIADDILVNFDDVRSEATLKALAELAKKNQVILFTHHSQIVETVEALNMEGHIIVHPLVSSTSATI